MSLRSGSFRLALGAMKMTRFLRKASLGFLAALFLTSGICHFLLTRFFLEIMPPYLPFHREAVYISGVFELLGGLGLLRPSTRRVAGKGLFALTVMVTPANVHMWLNPELFPAFSPALLFWRLPAQAVLLGIIWFSTMDPNACPAHSRGRR